jgi:cytochrome o ubiquinol oxidase subunit 2
MSKNKKIKSGVIVACIIIFVSVAVWYLIHTNIPVLEPKGTIGLKERNLLLFALALSAVVVIPVFFMLFSFVWRYRESKPKGKYSPEFDHSRPIEALWWLIPSILIAILSVVTWNSSHTLDPYQPIASKTPQMTIQVVAMDWKWLFIYPKQQIASVNYVFMPINTPVDFEITSDSVMNSFWIPQLGGQIYAMPGMFSQLHLMATSQGNFSGSSANISGRGFAGMTFVAHAASEQSFLNWVKNVVKTPDHLTLSAYARLNRPSENNPVAYYSKPANNLFVGIISRYMSLNSTASGNNSHSYNSAPTTEMMQ